MNINILRKICAYSRLKNRSKFLQINKKFYEICCSNIYFICLNEKDKYLAFLQSCVKGINKYVKILLPHINPKILDNYALIWASHNGHTEVVKLLLNWDKKYKSIPKQLSVRNKVELRFIQHRWLLYDERIVIVDQYNYALIWASKKDYTDLVKLLLEPFQIT